MSVLFDAVFVRSVLCQLLQNVDFCRVSFVREQGTNTRVRRERTRQVDNKKARLSLTNPRDAVQFNSIQFYCKIGMTERSQWTKYKMNIVIVIVIEM